MIMGEGEEEDGNVGGERGRFGGSASGGGSRSRLDLASPLYSPRDSGATPGAGAGEGDDDKEEGEQEEKEGPDFVDGVYDDYEDELEGGVGMEGEGYVNESEMRRLVLGRVGGWVDWAVGWAVDFRGEDDGEVHENEDGDGDEGAEDEEGARIGGGERGEVAGEGGKGRKGGEVRWEEGATQKGGLDVGEVDRRLAAASSAATATTATKVIDPRELGGGEKDGEAEEGKGGEEDGAGGGGSATRGGCLGSLGVGCDVGEWVSGFPGGGGFGGV